MIVNLRDQSPREIEARFNDSNILIPTTVLWDDPAGGRSGLRISVPEATRQGMEEEQMRGAADLIKRSSDGEAPERMRGEVERFVAPYRKLRYCF